MLLLYDGTIALRCTAEPEFEHVDLEAAKNHARVDTDADDALIQAMIVAARRAAEGRLHRVLCASTWEWVVKNRRRTTLEIPVSPCSECQSVEIDGVALDKDAYSFIASGAGGAEAPLYASLSFAGGVPEGETITVKVTAGYEAGKCPKDIVQWMLVKITSFYEQREVFATGMSLHEFNRGFVDHLLDPYILP